MHRKHLRKALLSVSLLAWAASLVFVALVTRDGTVFGLQLLLGGAFGPLVGDFAWYANPAYFLALYWTLGYKPRLSRVAASIALALALLPLIFQRIWLNEGYPSPISSYGPGFQLWLGSIVLVALSAWWLPRHWPQPE